VCFGYERGWEAHRRNEAATDEIRRLFARYRAEAERARTATRKSERDPVPRFERLRERDPVLH
jgi:hypothetical protein